MLTQLADLTQTSNSQQLNRILTSTFQPCPNGDSAECEAPSQPAEAPMPLIVSLESGIELRFAKIRPERRGHQQFRVRNLPEQEIADAHFTTGANEQIRVGKVPRV